MALLSTGGITMKTENYSFQSTDGVEIQVNKWLPEKEPKAVLHLVHGSVEHVERYRRFAEFLTKGGIGVYASDIRGHGKTAGAVENQSYFSDEKNGWDLAISDLKKITSDIQNDYPGKPVFIFGHSMGSFLVRDYISKFGSELKGAILSGTGGGRVMLQHVAKVLSKLFMIFKGRKSNSPFLHKLLYGTLNDDIENAETDLDFLSSVKEEVKKYIDDPYCGHTITPEYLHEMVRGILRISKEKVPLETPDELPIHIFSGELDPVSGKDGKEVKRVAESYRSANQKDVTLKRYPGGRHEMLNESNREEVFADVLAWIKERI